jgi:putative peptidoglycan lipid II flippase
VVPALTALGHERRLGELRSLHDRTHLAICFVAVPASLGLALFAEPVMAVCFEHGHFGAAGVARGALGLRALTLAILPAGAAGLIARTYYAVGDFRTPVRISIAILICNIVLDTLAVTVFGFDVEGLALATALCSWLNVLLLVPGLTRRAGLPPAEPGFARRVAWMLALSVVAVGAARGLYEILGGGRDSVPRLGISILAAGVLYGGLSELLSIPEWRAFRAKLSRKHG